MKILKAKQEICKALNFERYPVLQLDLSKDKIKNMENCYRGQLVKCEYKYKDSTLLYSGNLSYYDDENKLIVTNSGVFLKATFDYNDIVEMTTKALAPKVKADQEVVIVIINSEKRKTAFPVLTKISKIDPNSQVLATIEGDFKEIIEKLK
jgi:hypothetical protein